MDNQQRLNSILSGYESGRDIELSSLREAPYPAQSEPALIHPVHSSIVKLRHNGMIDIFVGNDNGIRLDPSSRSISMIANTAKSFHTYRRSIVERDAEETAGGNWTLTANGNIDISAKGNVNITGNHVNIVSKGEESSDSE